MQKVIENTILFFLFSILNCYAQSYEWRNIRANIPGTPDLSDGYFVSDYEGWMSSSSHAEIYHTTNGINIIRTSLVERKSSFAQITDGLNKSQSGD